MSIQDEVAQAADVAKDNVCPFGQWLYGPTLPAEVHTSARLRHGA
jgi:hypothetical protein